MVDDVDEVADDVVGALDDWATVIGTMKLLVSHLQLLTSFTSTLEVEWPQIFLDISNFFSFINIDLGAIIMPCVHTSLFQKVTGWVNIFSVL